MKKRLSSIGKATIRFSLRVRSRWLLAGLLPLFMTGGVEAQMPVARVVVANVQRGELNAGQTFVGTIVPLRTSTVASAVEGLVDELLVREGAAVKKGATLAKLRDRQPKIREAAAAAELKLRENQRKELIESLPEEIAQAEARTKAAEALKAFTASRLKRTKNLIERGAISTDRLEETQSAALAAQEKHREAELAWRLAVAVQEEKLQQAEAQVLAGKQERLRLQDDLEEHTIKAPFDGYITKEHTEVGQWIAKGDPVVEIVHLDRVEVEVFVPETYLAKIREGMGATVTVEALPGELWQKPVSAIVPLADVRSRSFPVKVEIENSPAPGGVLLKPGMFARVALPVGSKANVLLVPKDAVVLGQTPVVFVVDRTSGGGPKRGPPSRGGPSLGGSRPGGPPTGPPPDGTARRVPVELGACSGELIEVRGLLNEGDLVVVEGNERLSPGQGVSRVKSGRSPTSALDEKPSK